MKTERVFLAEWLGDYTDGYNDIPWPRVHDAVGYDALRWINDQDHDRAQLILEKAEDRCVCRLYAEFYLPALRSEFALRFGR